MGNNRLKTFQFVFLSLIVAVTLLFSFLSIWLFVAFLLPRISRGDGHVQDLLGIHNFSTEQVQGQLQLLLNMAAIIILCVSELIPWLCVGYIVFICAVLGVALVYSRFLNEHEFVEVFGSADKWKRVFPAEGLMKIIASKCMQK